MSAASSELNEQMDNASFVAEMRPSLVKYFKRKTGSDAEAEDLAQDVLLRALTHSHWKTVEQAKGYIFRTAVNRWRDRLRRQRIRGIVLPWDEEHAPTSADGGVDNLPERVLIAGEELNQVVHALEGMSVRTRTVLILIKLEKMRVATVAEMLGISVSAVAKHLAKGVAQLAILRKQQERT